VSTDPLIFAPSWLMEGKSVGTAKHSDLALAKNLIKGHTAGASFASDIKQGVTVGRKKLAEIEERTLRKLSSLIVTFQAGKLEENKFRERCVEAMKSAWRDTFLAGIRAAGTPGYEVGKGKLIIPTVISSVDEAWLTSAMQHEMRFFNNFLDDTVAGKVGMPVLKRAGMYVDALESFYNSARVIGLPGKNTVLHWSAHDDDASCPGCRYLSEHSPYTKYNLPTVPRAGMCACLTNCRCRILVRKVEESEVKRLHESAVFTRDRHVANLRKLKRVGKL
jgi:hypothetical protein